MDVQKKLDGIVAAVEGARAMPMSASCVINRAELLAMLTELRSALPESLSEAQALLGDREQMVAEARQEAERIIEAAHEERGLLISHTELARHSQEEADRILADARRESEEIRAEADEYVDSKLANFEVVLTKTLGAVDRGRDKLLGREPDGGADGEYGRDAMYGEDADVPERTSDPAELRRRADSYVDAKLGAFETVLAKTLEAVGRGRQKLAGYRPVDELAEHLAAQDAQDARDGLAGAQSDAEYLAGLADVQAVQEQPPAATGEYGYAAAAEAQAGYGYPQDGYGYSDYAGYPAHAEHAEHTGQAGYEQQQYDAYGQIPQQGGYDTWQQQPQHLPQAYGYEQTQIPQQQPYPGLDETSFFDTSLINVEHLRGLDQGH